MGVALFAWRHTLSSAVSFFISLYHYNLRFWVYAYAFMGGFTRHGIKFELIEDNQRLRGLVMANRW
jgi:hypothetical protein